MIVPNDKNSYSVQHKGYWFFVTLYTEEIAVVKPIRLFYSNFPKQEYEEQPGHIKNYIERALSWVARDNPNAGIVVDTKMVEAANAHDKRLLDAETPFYMKWINAIMGLVGKIRQPAS